MQPRWRGHVARRWLAEWVVPHLCVDKSGEITGEQDRLQPRVPAWGNKTSKPLAVKSVGVAVAQETPNLTGQFV